VLHRHNRKHNAAVILTRRSARPQLSGVQPSLHHTCSGASSWCRIHASLTGPSGISWILNPCYGDSISKQVITMTDSLHKHILGQANATIDIKRILINYKKLSKANISLAKTKSRLAELQALWKEVRYRHNDITFVAIAEDQKKL
ncbi:hypothetical protein HN011_003265, partial [Eciton burchellii]